MKEKKKKSKAWLVLLIIVLVIGAGIFAYYKYLNGDLNKILESNEATKNLVVVDLDTEDREDEKEEFTLENGIDAKYYYDENNNVEIVEIECEMKNTVVDSKILLAAQTAAKAMKGVKFEYEEEDGVYEIDLTIAPGDVSQEMLDKVVELGIINSDQAEKFKDLLNNPTAENMNAILEKIKY